MKNRKRLLALLLSLALIVSLCACGSADGGGDATASSDVETSLDPDAEPTIEVDLSKDALDFSAGIPAGDTLLTVNGAEVKADRMLYWIWLNCNYFMSYYGMFGFQLADDIGDGTTYADQMLLSAVETATYYVLLQQKAVELGCLPTDAQVQEARDEMMADGQENYDSLKAAFGLTDESMEFLYLLQSYYENVLDAIVPTVTDEMLNSYAYQVKHILLSTVDQDTGEALDDETVAAQRALAEDILSQLQAVEGEEQQALFDELMNQYSEDGRDENGDLYSPEGYTAVPGDMVTEFEEASLALPIGGLSGIVESSYGYHIILRGEVDDLESYTEDCREYHLDKELDALAAEAEITRAPALDSLDVAAFYERYTAYQNAVMEQYYASVSDETGDEDAVG